MVTHKVGNRKGSHVPYSLCTYAICKFDDISRELARVAARLERAPRVYEEAGHIVSARESYFIASLLYGTARWPIFAHCDENQRLNDRKVECYSKYAQYAAYQVGRVEIPFEGKSISCWLHLPGDRPATGLPCVINIPGMDSFKEGRVAQYGDRLLPAGHRCAGHRRPRSERSPYARDIYRKIGFQEHGQGYIYMWQPEGGSP